MFTAIQILAVFLLTTAIIIYFGKIKHKETTIVVGLIICTVISAIISNIVLNVIPMPTDKVIVTATGEKNENASSNEVYITNLVVGGKECELKNPSEGKWFWKGNMYMWRREGNPNQPEGTTRSITIDIPYGRGRSIQFGLSKWNGIVEVSYDGDTQRYDLFKSSDEAVFYAPVADTDFLPLYGIKLLRIALFALIIALLMAYPIYAVVKFDYNTIKTFGAKNWDKLYYFTIALIYVILVQKLSVEGSLWSDEIWQLSWVYTGRTYGSQIIFDALSTMWYKIMPYGQQYLRLLSQLFVAGAIYFTGIAGSLYKNKKFGIIFSSSIAFSLSIFSQCAMEIRMYGMLMFSCSFVIYMYIRKQRNIGNEKIIELFIYDISLVLLMDTHSFGLVVAGLFMISDFILILIRKTSKKAWLEFIIPAGYGVFWLINTWTSTSSSLSNTGNNWVGKATPNRLLDALQWLFSYNNIIFSIFLFGIIIIAFRITFAIKNKTFDYKCDYITVTITLVSLTFLGLDYFYSTIISPNNSLIIDRYFMAVIVCLYFVMCYGLYSIIEIVGKLLNSNKAEQTLVVVTISTMCIFNCTQFAPWDKYPAAYRSKNQDFRSSIENVMIQNDCYNSSTILVIDYNESVNIGLHYYITHKDTRDDITHVSITKIGDEILSYNNVYISYVWGRDRQNEQLNSILDSCYELVSDNTSAKVKKYVKK